jgi:hypothetical protein
MTSSAYWAELRKEVETLRPAIEAVLLKATQGRVAKASGNGHSKPLSKLVRPNGLARRYMRPG